MSTKMELSLDDIITQTRKTGGGRRGGRGGLRGRGGRGGAVRNSGGVGGLRTGGAPRRGAMRSSGGTFRPRSGNPDGVWSHDKFQEAGGVRRSGGLRTAGVTSGGAGAKITISNLHFGVTDADIIELFGELGSIRYASVHYDRSGRSMGKADVLFERRASAQQAIQQYNGVPLDGRAMEIAWANATVAAAPAPVPRTLNRVSGGRVARNVGSGRGAGGVKGTRGVARGGRGGGRGRGGRTQTKTPTAEELDAELDAYVSEKQQ